MNELEQFIQLNNINKDQLNKAIHNDILEHIFELVCHKLNNDKNLYLKTKQLYFMSNNENYIVKQLIDKFYKIQLSSQDLTIINVWLHAYFNKNSERVDFSKGLKEKLTLYQQNKCAICHKHLDNNHTHIDHIIPFSYVGDELENNYQALCEDCNWKKSNNLATNTMNLICYRKE